MSVFASSGLNLKFCQRHHKHMPLLVMLRSIWLAVGASQGCHAFVLPPCLGSTPLLHCRTTLSITQVGLRVLLAAGIELIAR